MSAPLGRLAGVIHLELGGRGPKNAYLFDPHRLALPCWAHALEGVGPALLVTLDRHFDLVRPTVAPPNPSEGLWALDAYARGSLDVRNVDHVLAAMEAGLVGDAIVIARSAPQGAIEDERFVDSRGRAHELLRTRSVDRIADDFGRPEASPLSRYAQELVRRAERILLDVDLDCFTTPQDVDPTEPVPWPQDQIRRFVRPTGSEPFWNEVLHKCVGLTLAREPGHCGGVVASGRLFEQLAEVLFRELLNTDLP